MASLYENLVAAIPGALSGTLAAIVTTAGVIWAARRKGKDARRKGKDATLGANSVAPINIAGGSVGQIIHNDPLEIAKAVDFLYRANAPRTQDVAAEAIRTHLEDFKTALSKALAQHSEIQLTRFTSPDLQFALQSAAISAARTENKDKRQILAGLLGKKSAQEAENELDIIYGAAIEIVPKLSPAHLQVLATTFLLTNFKLDDRPLNLRGEFIAHVLTDFKGVSFENRCAGYLVSLGLAEYIQMPRSLEVMMARDEFVSLGANKLKLLSGQAPDPEMLKEVRQKLGLPEDLWETLDNWNGSECSNLHIGTLGKVVALSYLEVSGKFSGEWQHLI